MIHAADLRALAQTARTETATLTGAAALAALTWLARKRRARDRWDGC